MSPIGVTITASDAVTHEGMIYQVPKLVLISRVQALLHDGRLKIQKGLPDALVAVLTSRLPCRKAGNTRIFTPDRESSGESRLEYRDGWRLWAELRCSPPIGRRRTAIERS